MQVSFILSLFNQLSLTQACLASLRATVPANLPGEIILIDDGSTDGTREWLTTLAPPVRVLLNDRNLGFAASNNRAARAAQGDILCFLNSDLELLPGWLEPMLAALQSRPAAGVVGNLQRRTSDGVLDHRGVRFDPLRHPYHDQRPHPWSARRRVVRYAAVTAACCVVRRARFLAAGGFDEAFRNGYEDVDLCLRLTRDHGLRHYIANTSVVRHHVAASRGDPRSPQQCANLRMFLARWGWPPPGPPSRLLAWIYLRRHLTHPWRYNGPKLLLALARLASNRRCDRLVRRWHIARDVVPGWNSPHSTG